MMISVTPVLKLRSIASAILQRATANLAASVVLAWAMTASGDPAAAQSGMALRQQRRLASTEPQRHIALRTGQHYLDRPHSYKPVQFVPFNYGDDIFPSWRQILPQF